MLEQFKDAMVKWYAEELSDINPFDEEINEGSFLDEARTIVEGFLKAEKRDKYHAADIIQPIFKVKKGKALSVYDCADAVDGLIDTFKCAEECIPFYNDTELRDYMVDGNVTPVMRVAEHFIVDCFTVGKKCYVYLNERIYKVVAKNKVLALYKSLLNDADTVYVQYRRPMKNGLEGYYTKTVKKSKYNYSRLKKRENILQIFDKQSEYETK